MAEIDPHSGGEQPLGTVQLSGDFGDVPLSSSTGALRVNLRWNPSASGRLRHEHLSPRRPTPNRNPDVDLDLGCFYQFTDGQRGVIQAVGSRWGDFAGAPFIRLDRDRVGSSPGKNLFINMNQAAHFQRILIFVMVASGTEDLTKTGASVTIYPTAGPALEIRLEGSTPVRARSCAVAQIRRQDDEIVVHRELRYFTGYQSEIDKAFNWGLHWGPGPGKSWSEVLPRRTENLALHQIPVLIYVSDEAAHESVEAATDSLLDEAGLEITQRDPPIIGSWFRKSSAAPRDDKPPSTLRDVIQTAAHVADTRLVHAQDATITATLMAGLSPLLVALQPTKDAAVRIGALLVVKVDWAVGVHQLTAAQQLKLDHNPQLVATPKQLIDVLCLPPPSG